MGRGYETVFLARSFPGSRGGRDGCKKVAPGSGLLFNFCLVCRSEECGGEKNCPRMDSGKLEIKSCATENKVGYGDIRACCRL